ncbi:hypothetical protein [Yersinia phage phiR8-01]|uniref:Uncharacterized protein n=1 Tax=Yersinia phage phiR8-01 TaxID=1206556 RepID=I7LGX2_9CAUD|nr:hypothetical protein HOT05_gp28 [Yersinia phage phiR8-01]CCI88409.2 hypothetical protein [Yersinia phage phiR8-01]
MSDWCMKKWEEAVERGDLSAADDYPQMYNHWKEKGL